MTAGGAIGPTALVVLLRKLHKQLPNQTITDDELAAIEPLAQQTVTTYCLVIGMSSFTG